MDAIENELKDKMFLSGDGSSLGEKDNEAFAKVNPEQINQNQFPNLSKWYSFMKKVKTN